MYEIINNWMGIIVLLTIFLLSLQLSINSENNIVIKLINALITVIIFSVLIFISQNKFITEREAKLQAEFEFQRNAEKEKIDDRLLEEAKEDEQNNTHTIAMLKEEKDFVYNNINRLIAIMKDIQSLHSDRYDTILEDNYLFEKYMGKSLSAYQEINRIYNSLYNHNFQSQISSNKTQILRAVKLCKIAGKNYHSVFYKEQDVAYPGMVSKAKKATHSLYTLKKDLK